jgi:ribosomal protein L11 methyltransferase
MTGEDSRSLGFNGLSETLMKQWLAISILVPTGLGEGISNFLMEQGATGIEEIDEDLKWKRLKAYFLRDRKERSVLRATRRYLKSLESLGLEISHTRIQTSSIREQDWGENWKRFFKPFKVGTRFVIKPPWSKARLKKGQIAIEITPGMAFGTGTHATTKLCIQALEARLRKGLSVLDVGTGSGILSIVAARLGAGGVWGLDIDAVALENAKENVRQNGVSNIIKIRKGRIGDVQKRFDVTVTNIDLKNLRRMRWPLIHHLKDHGFLVLSGILMDEEEKFRQYYVNTGVLKWIETTHKGEWACITFQKLKVSERN